MSILIGDAVAVRAGAHGLQQGRARRLRHVVPRRGAKPTGIGARDGLEGEFRVGARKALEHAGDAQRQILAGKIQRGLSQRRAEQNNAEIGVLPDPRESRLDGGENPRPDIYARRREGDRGDMGAVDEILGLHAMPGGEDMNIAGLWRLQFVLASREEGLSQR